MTSLKTALKNAIRFPQERAESEGNMYGVDMEMNPTGIKKKPRRLLN